eukprot:COSAG05_NODE_249_length_12903_cov_128.635505_14_plen_244_part_01
MLPQLTLQGVAADMKAAFTFGDTGGVENGPKFLLQQCKAPTPKPPTPPPTPPPSPPSPKPPTPQPTPPAALKTLTFSPVGTLSPPRLEPGVKEYTLTEPANTTHVTVDAVAADPKQSLKLNGLAAGTDGHAHVDVPLKPGNDIITIEVLAPAVGGHASTTASYTIKAIVPKPTWSCDAPSDGECKAVADGSGRYDSAEACASAEECQVPKPAAALKTLTFSPVGTLSPPRLEPGVKEYTLTEPA